MNIGIDASNLRLGGGVTHIIEILKNANPEIHGFDYIYIWATKRTLDNIDDNDWLVKRNDPALESNIAIRQFWLYRNLKKELLKYGCGVLFSPGGSISSSFRPAVTMSRNMLPFEWSEIKRYGVSLMAIRLIILRFLQLRSFKNASGLIFLTTYVRDRLIPLIHKKGLLTETIPHGVNERFFTPPRKHFPIESYTHENRFKIIYVSTIDHYKHQKMVVMAVNKLISVGYPLKLTLIGSSYLPALIELKKELEDKSEFISYIGSVDYKKVNEYYLNSDLCVFASTCENMPNILLEGMAAGLPIACSNYRPMTDILGSGGLYFDPEDFNNISEVLEIYLKDSKLREINAQISFEKAKKYSWYNTTNETFNFLNKVSNEFLH